VIDRRINLTPMSQTELQEGAPVIDANLIRWLTTTNPQRLPDPNQSERELWMEVGKQRLIRTLMSQYEAQQLRGVRDVHV